MPNGKKLLSQEFVEWFRGFTDAEGCFYIAKRNGSSTFFEFRFIIELHVDDMKALEFIKSTLGIGVVRATGSRATFTVSTIKEVKVIMDIFTNYPLNSSKHLNFLGFKEAFQLYTANPNNISREEILSTIDVIKSGASHEHQKK